MKNQPKPTKAIAFLMLVAFFFSCSARKVNKVKTEEKVVTEIDSTYEVSKNKDVITDIKKESEARTITDEYEITPIDTSKAIEVTDSKGNVTKIKNGALKGKKSEKQERYTSNEKTQDRSKESEKTTIKKKVDKQIKSNTKELERKEPAKGISRAFTTWGILGIMTLIIGVLWYVGILRKKKSEEK